MSDKSKEQRFSDRFAESQDVAATADHKINELLDLLEQKDVIEPAEAKRIRDAKVY